MNVTILAAGDMDGAARALGAAMWFDWGTWGELSPETSPRMFELMFANVHSLFKRVAPDVRAQLSSELGRRGITLRGETMVRGVEREDDGSLTLSTEYDEIGPADAVLFATGRRPNTQGLGLPTIGVKLDELGAVPVDEASQTVVPSIFAVGDCTNRLNLTPVAIAEGRAVAEALFYLDTDVKDARLARPLGLKDCAKATCPEALESPWADRGEQHLQKNLEGLQLLLFGCPAGMNRGFDDLLEAAGAPALAEQTRVAVAAAVAALDAIPGESLRAALADPQGRAAMVAAHDAVREVTSLLKMEFSMTLAITSSRVEGDHD